MGCPSIFKTNHKSLIIIGTIPAMNKLPRNVLRKLGKGELAIEVPREILLKP